MCALRTANHSKCDVFGNPLITCRRTYTIKLPASHFDPNDMQSLNCVRVRAIQIMLAEPHQSHHCGHRAWRKCPTQHTDSGHFFIQVGSSSVCCRHLNSGVAVPPMLMTTHRPFFQWTSLTLTFSGTRSWMACSFTRPCSRLAISCLSPVDGATRHVISMLQPLFQRSDLLFVGSPSPRISDCCQQMIYWLALLARLSAWDTNLLIGQRMQTSQVLQSSC